MIWLPAKDAAVPNLLPRGRLETANQLTLATTYGITPVAAALLLAGLTTGLSGVYEAHRAELPRPDHVLAVLPRVHPAGHRVRRVLRHQGDQRPHRPARAATPGVLREFVDGWTYVGKTPLVRGLVLGILGAFAGGGVVIGSAQFYAKSLGGGESTFYILFAMIFVGLAIGIAAGPRLIGALSRRRWFGLSIVLAGVVGRADGVRLAPVHRGHLRAAGRRRRGDGLPVRHHAARRRGRRRGARPGVRLRQHGHPGRADAGHLAVQRAGRCRQRRGWSRVGDLVGHRLDHPDPAARRRRRRHPRRHRRVPADGRQARRAGAAPTCGARCAAARSGCPRRSRGAALFVVFEGGEGAGKSTQVDLLAADALGGRAATSWSPASPAPPTSALRIRSLLLDRDASTGPAGVVLAPRAEALLYAADRAHHVATVVRPALARGAVVISDRYIDSSLAYQGAGRTLPVDEVSWLSAWATGGLRPDLVVLLDVDPAVGLARVADRGGADRLEGESRPSTSGSGTPSSTWPPPTRAATWCSTRPAGRARSPPWWPSGSRCPAARVRRTATRWPSAGSAVADRGAGAAAGRRGRPGRPELDAPGTNGQRARWAASRRRPGRAVQRGQPAVISTARRRSSTAWSARTRRSARSPPRSPRRPRSCGARPPRRCA